MKKILFIVTLLFVVAQVSFSQSEVKEVVYLKNGSIIKGMIIEEIPNKSLKIETSDGSIFVCDIKDVEKITKERVSSSSTSRNTNRRVTSVSTSTSWSSTDLGDKLDIKGYKGFVDLGYTAGVGDYGTGRVELTTSHGYQFNSYLFVGGGTGFQYYHEAETFTMPIFADIRANFMKGPIVPFVGFKAGYTFDLSEDAGGLGCYLSPSAGVKLAVSSGVALNLSVGYTAQMVNIDYEDYSGYYSGHVTLNGVSFKVGIEF